MSYPGGDMKEFPAGAVFTVRERITQAKLHVVKCSMSYKVHNLVSLHRYSRGPLISYFWERIEIVVRTITFSYTWKGKTLLMNLIS